jgi:hypothetical protein
MKFGERRKGKENDKTSIISENTTSVKVKDIGMCTESYLKMGGGR